MIHRVIFILTLFFSFTKVFAQSSNILIIPFGDRMFYNEATADMIKTSGVSYSEMVRSFEDGLINALQAAGGRKFISPSGARTTANQQDLKFKIRSLLDFYLEPVGGEKKSKFFSRPESKLKNTKEKKKNGEVVSKIGDNKDSYIASKVSSRREFAKLVREVGVCRVMVINEFDIKEDLTTPYNNGNEHLRQIQVHYTLFDNKGKKIKGGVALKNFSSSENNVNEIIKKYFNDLAKDILESIE